MTEWYLLNSDSISIIVVEGMVKKTCKMPSLGMNPMMGTSNTRIGPKASQAILLRGPKPISME
jgi:hypothetical protein